MDSIARFLDHTLLAPEAQARDVERVCAEALEHGFAAVCVNGRWVARCARALAGSSAAVCAVVGFPLGAMASRVKALEARAALEDGAREIDMVWSLGSFLAGDEDEVRRDIEAVRAEVHGAAGLLKVILETARLSEPELARACRLVQSTGADFLKTSTGFGPGGATVEVVAAMRRTAGPSIGIKASGGVRTREFALALLAAGATRLGTSAPLALLR